MRSCLWPGAPDIVCCSPPDGCANINTNGQDGHQASRFASTENLLRPTVLSSSADHLHTIATC